MTKQIKESYCNDPLTCNDFRNTQRDILGSVHIPTDPIRVELSAKPDEREHRGNVDTSWWQVP